MNQESRLFGVAVGFLTMFASTMFASTMFGQPAKDDSGLELTIRIYDYAGTPESATGQMKTELQWILGKSGTSVAWLNCKGANQPDRQSGCAAPLGSSDLILRIVPTATSSALPQLDENCLGFTAAKSTGGGKMVTVSLAGAQALASMRIVSLGKIMAYVTAHEIGHVFLGSGHSPRGVMTPLFKSAELQQIKMRQLIFSSDEREALRSGIQKRINEGLAKTGTVVSE